MTELLQRYLELEKELLQWRSTHPEDMPEEDEIMDAMEEVWWKLTSEETEWINRRNPTYVSLRDDKRTD